MYKKPIKSHMCIEVLEHAGNNAVFRFYDNLDGVSESLYCSNDTKTPYFVAGEDKGAELIKQVKDPNITGEGILNFLFEEKYVLQSVSNEAGDTFDSITFIGTESGEKDPSIVTFLIDNGKAGNRMYFAPNDGVFFLKNISLLGKPDEKINLADYEVLGIKGFDNFPAFYSCGLRLVLKGKPIEEAEWVAVESDRRQFALSGVESLSILSDDKVVKIPEK